MDSRNLTPLFNHSLRVCSERVHLAADRSVYNRRNLLDYLFKIASFLGNQRRIGGDAADNSHIVGFSDLIYIGCVNKKLHFFLLPQSSCLFRSFNSEFMSQSSSPSEL